MATTTAATPDKLPTGEEDSLQESRRSVTKEQWKNLLQRLADDDDDDDVPDDDGGLDDDDLDADSNHASGIPWMNATPQRPVRSSVASSIAGAETITTENGTPVAETDPELNELNRDLDATADNLADLEIEFAEEFKNVAMGLSSVFADWNTSQQDLISASTPHPPNGALITDESLRSEFGISMRSADIGTSIRSIKQHSRRMNHLKRDMELSFKQLFKQENLRKQNEAAEIAAKRQSDASAVEVPTQIAVLDTEKEINATEVDKESNKATQDPATKSGETAVEEESVQKEPIETETTKQIDKSEGQASTQADAAQVEERAMVVHDDEKVNFWFGRIWSAIESLLAKRRAHRLARQLEAQRKREAAREAELNDRSIVKSFWRLFLFAGRGGNPAPAPAPEPSPTTTDPAKAMKAEVID